MRKTDIRQIIRQRKAACSKEERAALSAELCRMLENEPHVAQARTILLYYPLPDEADLRPLIVKLADRRILLPVVVGDDLELRLYEDEDKLSEGAFHILEPQGKAFTNYEEIEAALIPGVAFTREGDRLGRGKGFYDRLLSRLTKTYKIGVCWPFQIVEAIPHEEHDIRMDKVI